MPVESSFTQDTELLEEGRDTDVSIGQVVFGHVLEQDAAGEWRIVTPAAQDITDLSSLPILPHYSSDPVLAEQAFHAALAHANRSPADFELVCPEGLYGDAWGIREITQMAPLVTAASQAVVYCRAAIAMERDGRAASAR